MKENLCPECGRELEWEGHYFCPDCQVDYDKVGSCPDCGDPLEKLQACGAASYFCNHCNELKSKSRVEFVFRPKANSV